MPRHPVVYQIHICGLLDPAWSTWFDELEVTHTADNNTILSGPLPDQAALHGVLNKIRDLGLTLLSISTEATGPRDGREA